MKLISLLCAAMLAMAAAPAFAQSECYQNDQVLVIAQDRVDEVGTDFIVRDPVFGKFNCVFEINDDDVVIGAPGDPLHFARLVGQYLVLTRSTGPQGDLVIYDVLTDLYAPILDVGADDDDLVITDESLTYWQELIRGTSVNCPSYAENTAIGFGSVIYEERVLDFATLTVASTGQTRCSSTQ